jgi:hypothetical protein
MPFPGHALDPEPDRVEVRPHLARILGGVPRRKSEPRGPRRVGHGAVVGVTDAVGDVATPPCAQQTTPAFAKERARVLCYGPAPALGDEQARRFTLLLGQRSGRSPEPQVSRATVRPLPLRVFDCPADGAIVRRREPSGDDASS